MRKRVDIRGVIIPNNYKWYYEWFGFDATCPKDVEAALKEANGQPIDVYINSPGGEISSGSEIYTMLRAYMGELKIYVTGEACSAASIIAMAGYCEMSPTSLMMVHCTSTSARGNHNDMEHAADVLKTADEALANAYMAKSGMSREEVIAMMEEETWLTAEQAKEKGLIDGIMFERKEEDLLLTASTFRLPSQEQMDKVRNLIEKQTPAEEEPAFSIHSAKARLNLLKLKGEVLQ